MDGSTGAEVPGMVRDWSFRPAPVACWKRRRSIETFLRMAHRRPAWHAFRPVFPRPEWIVYFLFAPDGVLRPAHVFTLGRLRECGLPVLVVCSSPDAGRMPSELPAYCDALYWKSPPGFDFSAYTLALEQISRKSPGADVLVFNDSVFGPFGDVREMLARARWDLTGFTASNQIDPHIQSYAFILREVTRRTMRRLAPVMFPFASLSKRDAVILLQETRLARVAARSMTVGAFWYADMDAVLDPSLMRSLELLDAGFPFVKRRLMLSDTGHVNRALLGERLLRLRHPVDW